MAGERNAEHRDSATDQPNPAEVLDAAAELCAAVLLSGAAGCSLDAPLSGGDYPALDDFRPIDGSLVRSALATRLFTAADPAARQFAPNHRQLAEFLGARHLASRIESGLPVGRVFALMTAPDGAAPTPLRGLAAWLAAHCRPVRARLIERDPVGIAAYGDIHDFSPAEKGATPEPDPRSGSETRGRTPARRRAASPRGPRSGPGAAPDPRIAGARGCRPGRYRLRSPGAGAWRADAGVRRPAPRDRPRRDAVVRCQSAGARRLLPQLRRRGGAPGGRAPTPARHPPRRGPRPRPGDARDPARPDGARRDSTRRALELPAGPAGSNSSAGI